MQHIYSISSSSALKNESELESVDKQLFFENETQFKLNFEDIENDSFQMPSVQVINVSDPYSDMMNRLNLAVIASDKPGIYSIFEELMRDIIVVEKDGSFKSDYLSLIDSANQKGLKIEGDGLITIAKAQQCRIRRTYRLYVAPVDNTQATAQKTDGLFINSVNMDDLTAPSVTRKVVKKKKSRGCCFG